jgi:5S rRNA maturation endonuclease (ribonuclease M5)
VLRGVGAEQVKVVSHDKVTCCCLLAAWTHPKGRDRRPSMAVLLEADGRPHYTCLSCHEHGSLRSLLLFLWTRGRDVFRWIEVLDGEVTPEKAAKVSEKLKKEFRRGSHQGFDPQSVPVRPPLMVPTSSGKAFYDYKVIAEAEKIEELPAELYEPYRGSVPRYAIDRGLTLETCREWELGNDKEMKRLLFPIRDRRGRLVAISGRIYVEDCPRCGGWWIQPCDNCGLEEGQHDRRGDRLLCIEGTDYRPTRAHCAKCGIMKPPKYLHSKGFKRNYILYGEHRQEQAPDGRVYVVEGHLDMIKMWQAGYRPVVALLGSHPGEAQIEKLIKYWEKIIVVPDGNQAGWSMGEAVKKMVAKRVPVTVKRLENNLDPGQMTEEQFRDLLGPPPLARAA